MTTPPAGKSSQTAWGTFHPHFIHNIVLVYWCAHATTTICDGICVTIRIYLVLFGIEIHQSHFGRDGTINQSPALRMSL